MGCNRFRQAQRATRPQSQRWLPVVVALTCIWTCVWTGTSSAQTPPRVHYLHHEFMPPGAIGQEQLRRHAGMAGYFQAVELIPPEGARISILQNGAFQEAAAGSVLAGMQLGYAYSIKLTRLPNREGVEIFPSIEVVNRLFPPEGVKTRFPVPIEITEEDIAQALNGLFVMRVVYLEDSDQALPRADDPRHQRFIDVSSSEDPLHVADRMGRPMAILRIGSRVPDEAELGASGLQSPPIQIYPAAKTIDKPVDVNAAIERHDQDVPREAIEPETRSAILLPGWRYLR